MSQDTTEDTSKYCRYTRSFVVRLWCEDLGQSRREWRSMVQDLSSGEVRFFRDWQKLVAWVQEMLPAGREEGRGPRRARSAFRRRRRRTPGLQGR